jgi:hypothetical protein
MADVGTWNQAEKEGNESGAKMKDKATKGPLGAIGGLAPMGSKHSGGKVTKTGPYRLRKGEIVLTVGQQKAAGLKKTAKKKSTGKHVASKG